MFMEAYIDAMEFKEVFAIDRGLLNGNQELFVVKNDSLRLRKVNPIHFTETLAIIRGLEDGEEIIAQPLIGAFSGMEINPISFEVSK
jgi:hypothetical protein